MERLFILETATSIEKLTTLIEARLTKGFVDSVFRELEQIISVDPNLVTELTIRQLEEEVYEA